MKSDDFQPLTLRFLQFVCAPHEQAELSRRLGHNYNIYRRWLKGSKRFLWNDFLAIAHLKDWDVAAALADSFKILVAGNLTEQKILDSFMGSTSFDDKIYDVLSGQKISRVLKAQRKLQFNEFLLLGEALTNNAMRFLGHFLSPQDYRFLKKSDKHQNPDALYRQDILSAVICEALSLTSYLQLDQHSDLMLAKTLGASEKDIKVRIKVLNDMGIIEKNARNLFQLTGKAQEHFVFDAQTSKKVHHHWRQEIYRRSHSTKPEDDLAGLHLTYKSSAELDQKVIELSNRYYNDLRLIIQEHGLEPSVAYDRIKVVSLNLFDHVNQKNDP